MVTDSSLLMRAHDPARKPGWKRPLLNVDSDDTSRRANLAAWGCRMRPGARPIAVLEQNGYAPALAVQAAAGD